MKNLIKIFTFTFLIGITFGSEDTLQEVLQKYRNKLSNKEYISDSILFQQTMYMFRDSLENDYYFYNKEYFEPEKRYLKHLDSVKFYLTNILYNKDRTKFISFGLAKNIDENSYSPIYLQYKYDIQMLMGYREDNNSIWKIYPFCEPTIENFADSIEAIKFLVKKYFKEFKRVNRKVFDIKSKEFKYLNYKTISDPEFWDSFVWQKGTKNIKDKYWFEIKNLIALDSNTMKQIKSYRIDIKDLYIRGNNGFVYPDSILKLYPKSYQEKLEKDKK